MYNLKKLRRTQSNTLCFDGMHCCWITYKMLWASCKHAHNSCSCCSNVFSWIFQDICLHVLSEGTFFWCNHFLYLSIRKKKILGHTEMEMRQAFFMQNCCVLCHCVSAPQLWRNWGVCSVFPHWDECVWVEGKSLAVGNVGLSSSSLPVGQEDRDGFHFSRALIRPIALATTLHSHW